MELYEEIILKEWKKSADLSKISTELLSDRCYEALCQIKMIVDDETLSDLECFWRIEKIVCILENLGSTGGFRHDFG